MVTRIGVVIRVRPFLEHERRLGYQMTKMAVSSKDREIRLTSEDSKITKVYKFDRVFDPNTEQEDLYTDIQIDNLISKVVEGFHATIFAYGQTGSGKTYTMEGYKYEIRGDQEKIPRPVIDGSSRDMGMIPRAITALFDMINEYKKIHDRKYTVFCSFLQIYNEKIFDLLNPIQMAKANQASPGLRLRWNQKDEFVVENLYVYECKTAEEVIEHFHHGIKNRVVASHKLNLSSSRSHTILSLRVESVELQNPENVLVSKLDLVDLAGSEKTSLTGNDSSLAQKESIEINKSLFTLRQVISALADTQGDKKKNIHIPYRDSKLTSLLKQSIGGNCFCLMIACLSPADNYFEENLSTLNYATKAAFISNEPTRNDDPKNSVINDLKAKLENLTFELNKANEHIAFLSQIINDKLKTKTLDQSDSNSSQLDENSRSDKRTTSYSTMLENPTDLKKIDEILQLQNSNIKTENLPTRLIEAVNMVRDLLKSNKEIRELLDKSNKKTEQLEHEVFQLQVENQELRDKIEIYETLMQHVANSNENNKSWAKFLIEDQNGNTDSPTKADVASELLTLRKEKKMLENRVKSLEIENINLSQKLQLTYSTREPKRGLVDINPQVYQYNQALKHKNKFLQEESKGQQNSTLDPLTNSVVENGVDPGLFGIKKVSNTSSVRMPPIDSTRGKASVAIQSEDQHYHQESPQPSKYESILKAVNTKPIPTPIQVKQTHPYAMSLRKPNSNTPLRHRVSQLSQQSNYSNHRRGVSRDSQSSHNNLSFT